MEINEIVHFLYLLVWPRGASLHPEILPEGKAMVIDSYGTKNKNCTKVAIYLNNFFSRYSGFSQIGSHIL